MSPWLHRLFRPAPALVWGLDSRDLAWPDDEGACASAPHAGTLPEAIARLPSGAQVHVIAGNDLAVHWLQTPPAAVASLPELHLVAAARCAHLYGGSPHDWWVAGDWSATRPFVCAALPRALTAPLQQALDASRVRARWQTAWCVARGDPAGTFPSEGWSALRTPARVLLWHCRKGRVDCLASDRVSPGTTDRAAAEQAGQLLKLEAVREPSLPSGEFHWVGGAAEDRGSEARAALRLAPVLGRAGSKNTRLCFAPPGKARARLTGHAARAACLAGGALALASALLGTLAWEAWHTANELDTARLALQAAHQRRVAHAPSPERAAAALTPAQRTAWARIARQLNTPWAALLDALEDSLPDEVALVAIEPDAAQESVRLQVEAKGLDALLGYAGELRSVPLFAHVNLVKHETNEHDANRPVRLALNIRLRAQPGPATELEGALR